MFRTEDRHSGAAARDGEHAEHPENKRHSTDSPDQASEPDTRPPQRATDWKVGEERLEFPVGPGCVQRFKPLFKLATAEPPLSGGMSQPFGNLLRSKSEARSNVTSCTGSFYQGRDNTDVTD